MCKKIVLTAILLILSVNMITAETTRKFGGIPGYMQIDFFEKYSGFESNKLFTKVKYVEVPPEILKMEPKQIRFQSDDGIEIINISRSAGRTNAQTETWIAIDPNNPNNLIATANDNHYLSGTDGWRMAAFWSKDGGKSWSHEPTQPNDNVIFNVGNNGTIFDPGIYFNTKGEAFYSYGFTQTNKPDMGEQKNAVIVQKTTDGGESWSADWNNGLQLSPVAYAIEESNNPFHDRYSIAIDQNENSPYKDNIYISWQRFVVDAGPVISRSTDGGKTWSNPRKLENHFQTQAPMPIVGPDGDVYVAWRHQEQGSRAQAYVSRSTDGGVNYTSPINAQEVSMAGELNAQFGRYTLPDKQDIRISSPPQIAVDRSEGEYRNYVYVVQAGKDNEGNYGVFLSRSTDKGNSWKKNLRVDNNSLRNDMFFPSISVDPITGLIAVLYYTSQNDPNNIGIDAYVAISDDAGDSWSHIRVSPYTTYLNSPSTVFFQGGENYYWGDYTCIVAHDSKIYPLFWLPNPSSSFHFGTNDLFTALLSPVPNGVDNLQFENIIAEDVNIKLTWDNPTTNLFGMDLTDYNIIINRDGNLIAELPAGTEEYLDEDVVDGNRYRYEVIIKDKHNQVSGPKYVVVDAGGSIIPLRPYNVLHYPNADGFELHFSVSDTMIDGTTFRDFDRVDVMLTSGDVIATVGSLDDNLKGEVQIDIFTEEFYELELRTYSRRGGESIRSAKLLAYAGEILTDLSENFDDADNLIPMHFKGEWAITDEIAVSAPNSLADSPYKEYESNLGSGISATIMAPITISDKTTLSFDFIALVANQPGDNAEVNVIELNGNRYILKWFDRTISENFGEDLGSSSWEQFNLDLSDFVGKTIMVEFAMQSNAFKEDYGFYIDNVVIDNSPVSVADRINQIQIGLSLYPNPATESASLNVGYSNSGLATIEIYDILGNRVIDVENSNVQAGSRDYHIDLSGIANGSYMVKVSLNGKIKTIPLIVNK